MEGAWPDSHCPPLVCCTGAGEQEVDSCLGQYGRKCNVDGVLSFCLFQLDGGGGNAYK